MFSLYCLRGFGPGLWLLAFMISGCFFARTTCCKSWCDVTSNFSPKVKTIKPQNWHQWFSLKLSITKMYSFLQNTTKKAENNKVSFSKTEELVYAEKQYRSQNANGRKDFYTQMRAFFGFCWWSVTNLVQKSSRFDQKNIQKIDRWENKSLVVWGGIYHSEQTSLMLIVGSFTATIYNCNVLGTEVTDFRNQNDDLGFFAM